METYSNYNIQVVFVASLASLFAGYAFSVIVATLGQPTFYSSLNLSPDPTSLGYAHTVRITGAVLGTFYGAAVFGTFLSAWSGDKYGRVVGMRIGAITGIIGGILQTGSVNVGMYLLARAFSGLSTGQLVAAMGTYFSEIAPPHSRGLIGGAHGSFLNAGFALSAWVGYGCFHSKLGTFGWRFPNAVLTLLGLFLLVGTYFVPESPRWLVSQGKADKALHILCRLHHDANDSEDLFAKRELELIQKQFDIDHKAIEEGGRWQIFTQKTYRRRLVIAVSLLAGGQNIGILVVNSYNTIIYQSLGMTTNQALILGAGYNTWGMICNMMGAPLSDRFGRRKVLVFGFAFNVATFAIITAMIAKYTETGGKNYAIGAIVFLYILPLSYGAFIDVNQYTYASEIFPSHLRSQGSSLGFAAFFMCDALWIGLVPTALAAIGWKYFLVFIILGALHTTHLYFKMPEVTGLALEAVDAIFGKEAVQDIESRELDNVDKSGTTHIEIHSRALDSPKGEC